MGSEYCGLNKRCFDVTMSKRTRKPLNYDNDVVQGSIHQTATCEVNMDRDGDGGDEELTSSPPTRLVDSENDDRKSLKELIKIGDEKAEVIINSGDQESTGRSSLGQHFTEEEEIKHLQLVKKKSKQGLKLRKLVSRCAKVVSHFVKAKREPTGLRDQPCRKTVVQLST